MRIQSLSFSGLPASPVKPGECRFAGAPEVKRQLLMAAQASANYDGTHDSFEQGYNLGRAQQAVMDAITDPAFKEVIADASWVDEAIELPRQGKTSLMETLESQGVLGTLFEIMSQAVYGSADGPDKIEASIPVKKPETLRVLMGERPTEQVRLMLKFMLENAFRVDGPLGETQALIRKFCDDLEMRLTSVGLGDLPIFKHASEPVEGQWADGE